MSNEEIKNKVKTMIADKSDCSIEDVKDESRMEDLGLDSLDIIELVMEVEREFHVVIPEDEAEKAENANDLVALVEKHHSNR